MTRYVALLRGINLGATRQVPMPALRQLAAGLGYADVATYINSGNLIFSSAAGPAALEAQLSAAVARDFGHRVDVAVRPVDALTRVLHANPYPDGDPGQVTVAFLVGPCPPDAASRIAAVATDQEPFTLAGTEVYVHYSAGIGRSKLAATFSQVIGVSATVRNLRTVGKIIELARR